PVARRRQQIQKRLDRRADHAKTRPAGAAGLTRASAHCRDSSCRVNSRWSSSLTKSAAHAEAVDENARARHKAELEQIAPADAGLDELLPIFQHIQLTLGQTIFEQVHLGSPLHSGESKLSPTSVAPPLHVRKHGGHFVRAKTQVGHAGVLVFFEEGDGDRIAFGEQLVRHHDVTGEPGAIPPCGHTREVRSHLVALPDAVADAALALKEVFSLVEHERTRLRIALPRRLILPTQKIRYRRG